MGVETKNGIAHPFVNGKSPPKKQGTLVQPTLPTAATPVLGASLALADLPKHVDWLAAGCRDLELWDPAEPGFLVNGWRDVARQTRTLLAGYPGRIGIHGPYQSLTLFAYDPLIAAIVADRLRCALYFAAEIGATQIVIHSPFTTFGSPYIPYSDPDRRRQELALARMVLGQLLPLAQEIGCVFVIENIYDTNPELLLELVASFHSPWVRMSLDVGHAFITQQIGGPPPDHWIRAAAPFLAHIHLHDTDGQADRHWAVGQGSVKWRAVFAELARLNGLPRLILEMKQTPDIERSVDWLEHKGYAH